MTGAERYRAEMSFGLTTEELPILELTKQQLLSRNEMLIAAYEICGCEKLRRHICITECCLLAKEDESNG